MYLERNHGARTKLGGIQHHYPPRLCNVTGLVGDDSIIKKKHHDLAPGINPPIAYPKSILGAIAIDFISSIHKSLILNPNSLNSVFLRLVKRH